jgi:hypothetical protein
MRSGLWLPVLCSLLAWPWACATTFQALQPLSRAEGTWTGSVEPVVLDWHRSGQRTTNIYLTIETGPPAREVIGPDSSAGPMIGRRVVLFDAKGNPIEWQSSFANRRARVTGIWDSQGFRLGGKLGWAIATRPGGERVDFSPLEASRIDWLPASASMPTSVPTPTTAVSPNSREETGSREVAPRPTTAPAMKLTATFTRVPPADINTKLTWNPVGGVKGYRVECSNDAGKSIYDSIDTDSDMPDVTLEDTPAHDPDDQYVRVLAMDGNGRVIATSNWL